MIFFTRNYFRKGYIALISVLLISAIGTAIMVSVISSGVMSSKTDFSLQQSGSARIMASSCAEEALQRISEAGIVTGNGNLTIASGSCSYTITSSSSQDITVAATGILGGVTSKIKVILATTTPGIILSSWDEVADF